MHNGGFPGARNDVESSTHDEQKIKLSSDHGTHILPVSKTEPLFFAFAANQSSGVREYLKILTIEDIDDPEPPTTCLYVSFFYI